MCFSWLSTQLTQEAKATGLVVQRRKQVKYTVLFGELEIESPYLWDKKTRRGARPVKNQMGIEHGGRSLGVERALADFGAEESFGQAVKRFEEHYGWFIDRALVRRDVEKTALKAQLYVDNRLFEADLKSSESLVTRPGIEQLLVELDGCHIRTGTLVPAEGVETTKKRCLPKRKCELEWREVRVGLARPLAQKEERTYVARMSKYPEVVGQLVSAGFDRGMSARTQVVAVADGGKSSWWVGGYRQRGRGAEEQRGRIVGQTKYFPLCPPSPLLLCNPYQPLMTTPVADGGTGLREALESAISEFDIYPRSPSPQAASL